MKIRLSWPPRALSPNGRPNRWEKARATKAHRREAWGATLEQPLAERARFAGAVKVHVHMTFHPKDRNRPDERNAVASMKAAEDGIADALGVNDRGFVITHEIAEPRKGGAVVVEVSLP